MRDEPVRRVSKLRLWIGGVIAALVLGALGSGVWEVIFRPVLSAIVDAVFRGISSISSEFRDSLYRRAAKGFNESHSLNLLLMFMAILASMLVMVSLVKWAAQSDRMLRALNKSTDVLMGRRYVVHVLVAAYLVAITMFIARASIANRITTWSLNSLSIVAPYITEDQRLYLRSQFHSVRDATDFHAFHSEVKRIAEANAVWIPEFHPF